MTEFRNATWIEGNRIDCEINHPTYGWIPCTLAEDDPPTAELWSVARDVAAPYVEPVISPPLPADLLALAAELRWQREIGGVTVGGMFVATDDRSKLLLQGARTAADANPAHVEGWKAASGWVDLDAATIIALSDAVRAHVSSCFALERDVAARIEAGEITTREQVETTFAAREYNE